MPKYKPIKEGIVDRFISAVFKRVGSGLESATIRNISKKDPELGKKLKNVQSARKNLDTYLKKNLSAKEKRQMANNEIPDFIKQSL